MHQQSSPYIDPLGSLVTHLNPLTPESEVLDPNGLICDIGVCGP
jgi:hypothetical protein